MVSCVCVCEEKRGEEVRQVLAQASTSRSGQVRLADQAPGNF